MQDNLCIIPYVDVHKELIGNRLYIVGNGFDLAHGVKSSYYDFEKTIGKNNPLKLCLNLLIRKPDIWGNLEENIAFLDREGVIRTADDCKDMFDLKEIGDENFSYADYFCALEHSTYFANEILESLPRRLRMWVETLKPDYSKRSLLKDIIKQESLFINFNYTEFLETLYYISKSNILYIHGDRRNKKEKLIFGHGYSQEELFNDWYEKNKNKKIDPNNAASIGYFYNGNNPKVWKSATRYELINQAIVNLEDYYSNSAKKTADVIKMNREFFNKLNNTSIIIVLGHSLSMVDHPYFGCIISQNKNPAKLIWSFSYYSEADKERISNFIEKFKINSNRVRIFKIPTI